MDLVLLERYIFIYNIVFYSIATTNQNNFNKQHKEMGIDVNAMTSLNLSSLVQWPR